MALADRANLAGLTGVLLLAYPAVFVARHAAALTRLASMPADTSDATGIRLRARTRKQQAARRDGWSFGKSACLPGGTFLAALSYALPLWPVLRHSL